MRKTPSRKTPRGNGTPRQHTTFTNPMLAGRTTSSDEEDGDDNLSSVPADDLGTVTVRNPLKTMEDRLDDLGNSGDAQNKPSRNRHDDADMEIGAHAKEVPEVGLLWTKERRHVCFIPHSVSEKLQTLLESHTTEAFIMLVITANSIMLAAFPPHGMATHSMRTRQMVGQVDIVFTALYTIECVLRIMAYGFWTEVHFGKPAYMNSGWNRLDLFVVVTSIMSYPLESTFEQYNVRTQMFRAFRVLRFVHAFRFFSGIRALLSTLSEAVGMMRDVATVFAFFFAFYIVLGMGLFSGRLRTKCLSPAILAASNMNVSEMTAEFNPFHWSGRPGDMVSSCPISLNCDSEDLCVITNENPRGGFQGYDNIASSLLTLIVATTGDNWQDLTFSLMDEESYMAPYLYHLSINLLLSLVGINLFVVVISSTFARVRERQANAEYVESLTTMPYSDSEDEEEMDPDHKSWVPEQPDGWVAPFYHLPAAEKLVSAGEFEAGVTLAIFGNTISLCMTHYGMSVDFRENLGYVEVFFTILFIAEMVIKCIGFGCQRYWSEPMNKIDVFINASTIVGLAAQMQETESTALRLFRVFRLARVARISRVLGKVESSRSLIKILVASWREIANLCLFITYCLFVFSLFGMHMMGDMEQFEDKSLFTDEASGKRINPRPLFVDFWHAFTTAFLMMTGDRWKVTMYTYMQTYGWEACLFFVLMWIMCSCVMLNLFVAVILENFVLTDSDKKRMQKEKYWRDRTKAEAPNENRIRKMLFKCGGCLQSVVLQHEDEVGIQGKAFFVLGPQNYLRILAVYVVEHPFFELFIIILITISSAMIAFEGRAGSLGEDILPAFVMVDRTVLILFWGELLLRSVACGFCLSRDAYLSDNWNKVDFVVVVCATLSIVLESWESVASLFRLPRLLRPIRFLNKIQGMKRIVTAVASSFGDLGGVLLMQGVLYLMFSVIGVSLFGGKFYRCTDADVYGKDDCIGTYVSESGAMQNSIWDNPGYSFDNIFAALRTLVLIGTTAGWSECLYTAMDVTGIDRQPSVDAFPLASAYFIIFLFICTFAGINLFVGVLINLFGTATGSALKTDAQNAWGEAQLHIAKMKPTVDIAKYRSDNAALSKIFDMVTHPVFDTIITVLILLNVIVMLSNFYPEPEWWGVTVEIVNFTFLCTFTVEAILKMIAFGLRGYVDDSWNRMDLFIVILSWIFAALQENEQLVQVVRMVRVSRIALLIKRNKGLRHIFGTFVESLPSVTYIAMLEALLIFVYANLGMFLFGHTKLGQNYNDRGNFQSFLPSLQILLQMATGQDILLIVVELSVAPPYCQQAGEIDPSTQFVLEYSNCGNSAAAFTFVATYFVLANYLLLNMIVAVVMESFESISHGDNEILTDAGLQAFRDAWEEVVVRNKNPGDVHELPLSDLSRFLEAVGDPLGTSEVPCPPRLLNMYLHEVEDICPAHDGCIAYDKLLTCLVMMTLSTECLTYAEKREKVDRARQDRSAKILVSAIHCWSKQRQARGPSSRREPGWMTEDPKGYIDALSVVRNFRLRYTCFLYKRSIKKKFDVTTIPTWKNGNQ